MPKFEQVRRMAAAGVRVPRTMIIGKDMPPLDPARWGEFVIVKPTDIKTSSNGDGIQLMRTGRVRYIAPEDYPEGHPGRFGPMVVQQYIDTGPGVSTYRVLTLFGQPLYSEYIYGTGTGIDYAASDEVIEQSPIAIQNIEGRSREFRYDADVIALARAAHAAIPEIPLKGVDVLRDHRTGLHYCIEVNPNCNAWIFSSKIGEAQRLAQGPAYTQARKDQLDAFGTAAQVLAAVTRREAN
jgi:glutathione synthase/RimK-type ligase-like ATP-grasp enzyme